MKKLFALCLTIIMSFCMTIPAFAEESETALGQEPAEVSSINEISPRVAPHIARLSLSTDRWTYLYDDNNILDENVYIENYEGNPGGIYVRIEAKTSSGNTVTIVNKSRVIPASGKYTIPEISSTYDRYVVYVMAESKVGTYQIKYSDWF